MRRYEFRVWDKRRKRMYYFQPLIDNRRCQRLHWSNLEGIAITSTGEIVILDKNGRWEYAKDLGEEYVVMLNLGLRDRNGREIYEGDIIKKIWYLPDPYEFGRFLVVWNDKEGKYEVQDDYGDILDLPAEEKKREVIGNIYENPELLEKEV